MRVELYFLLVACAMLLAWYWPRWRKRRLLATPFAPEWQELLEDYLPWYPQMSAEEQQRLRERMLLFLDHKQFHPCGGMELDESMRVLIAALACMLVLRRGGTPYRGLRHILVYPGTFVAEREERNEIGLVSTVEKSLAGESWENGKLILSWDDVVRDMSRPFEGYNVVWHEFAHQLDSEDGSTNGAPVMSIERLHSWSEVFSREYAALQEAERTGEASVLDLYGAESPAEFFAVATETFFSDPESLQHYKPELFEELRRYYGSNPLEWLPPLEEEVADEGGSISA